MRLKKLTKKSRFPLPSPLPLATVMDSPASKALLTGPYQTEVHRYFITVERNFEIMINNYKLYVIPLTH